MRYHTIKYVKSELRPALHKSVSDAVGKVTPLVVAGLRSQYFGRRRDGLTT